MLIDFAVVVVPVVAIVDVVVNFCLKHSFQLKARSSSADAPSTKCL